MVLVVDDDIAVRSMLSLLLRQNGFEVTVVASPPEAMEHVRRYTPELILMDMNYTADTSGEEGITLLKQVKIFCPDVPVILITAWGSIHLAVRGMKAGAFDFITKPWSNETLVATVRRAVELSSNSQKSVANSSRVELNSKFHFEKIVGQSAKLMEVLNTVARVAQTDAPILITGESGTGKELIAEAIHANSRRGSESIVKVNLGGVSQSLFESEMFGHKKGAFTDAYHDRIGRFSLANGGTIFLDELGELDLSCQVKLLRVLQEQTFEVLGESRPTKVDVRIVCATNKDLSQLVANGLFREDLFYRVNLITIHLPALRERPEDIPFLAKHFAQNMQGVDGRSIELGSSAIDLLQRLPFPGNIRELKNLVERTVLVSGKSVIEDEDITRNMPSASGAVVEVDSGALLPLDEMERKMIVRAMELYSGNISKVADALGLSRAALYRRLEKYGIRFD
ncbi:sigma-54 dependent transcriptional regulator [uncultured Acetobacteroides sp.]|uniref:sigma-54-dependent transcriptional regulator n=1 Tax=uncultured Acetobacteroides sp. TaxID=1760811 RepID=UPI0029F520EB|nr:sigma-54 dependent transcriptional regulator [uncultured Acetobacteroides sp.]